MTNPQANDEHFTKSLCITCWAIVFPIHEISLEIIEGTMNSATYHRILLEKGNTLIDPEK